jgi:methylmalonyl-CoA mutase cobalamin-binding subunit
MPQSGAASEVSVRRSRRAVVALVGVSDLDAGRGWGVVESLTQLGVQTIYLGAEDSAHRIADAVVRHDADSVELCLIGGRGVLLLRELVRELIQVGRRDASIVLHRRPLPRQSRPNHAEGENPAWHRRPRLP